MSEGFKGATRGSPIMPRDVSLSSANVGTVGMNGLIVFGAAALIDDC